MDGVDPIKETGDPLEFLVFLAPAYDFGIATKVNVGVATVPSFGEGSFAQEVVEFAEVAYTAGLDYSSTPPADVDTYIKGTTCQFFIVSLFTALEVHRWTVTHQQPSTSVLPAAFGYGSSFTALPAF